MWKIIIFSFCDNGNECAIYTKDDIEIYIEIQVNCLINSNLVWSLWIFLDFFYQDYSWMKISISDRTEIIVKVTANGFDNSVS